MPLLGDAERAAALAGLRGWTLDQEGRAITRTFRFRDFPAAFAFMTRAALTAETLNHHPDWSNSYGTVTVRLTTHSAGGLTEKDVRLAQAMDGFAAEEGEGRPRDA